MKKRKGNPVNGWVAVDKPAGIGSTNIVAIVKRLFNAQKAGHGGTLDPAATGVLPVALGEATKTIQYVMDGRKTYRFTVRFGQSTSTDDAEGEIIAQTDVIPSQKEIEAVLPLFVGEIDQVPPKYSAVHVNGKRAYDLARENQEVDLAPRRIRIDALRLTGMPDAFCAEFEADCGKGTYVRSIARDLAEKLGSLGHITALRRTACGKFSVENAFSLEYLRSLEHILNQTDVLRPVETVLDDIPALALSEADARLLSNGGFLPAASFGVSACEGETMQALCNNRLTALVRVQAGQIRPVRIIVQ